MNLIDAKNNIKKLLSLSDEDIRDLEIASDHHLECKCKFCEKYEKIMSGKYISKND